MARLFARALFSAALFAGACSAAYADRIAAPASRPLVPIAVAPDAVRSPYTVEIVADDGDTLDTYFHKGRYYVRGATDRAYTIRVANPTPQRVEAVISIDGLDVIDGENGDLHKRGYIVPAYGEVRIEGWRTSLENVAAFRFSAVKNSYAGRKGKARNVGVIAVALFAENAPAMIVQPGDPYLDGDDDYDGYGDEVDRYLDRRWHGPSGGDGARAEAGGGGMGRGQTRAPAADKAAEPSVRSRPAPPPPGVHGGTGSVTAGAPARQTMEDESARDCCGQPERLGLGTEYGETRYSAASYTRFVRSSDKPVAIAELRYNDDAGLKALGILFAPEPDANELMTRETADPFPGDRGFARPPAGIR
ncbi:MAG: hypothetical protein IPL61_29385 [Myxococcales bacterium]|nr:hypothetical protein [Myxococcales bacterium]